MNQCPLCKTTHPDGQLFCPDCGAKLVPVQQEKKPEKKTDDIPKPDTSKPARARSSKVPVIVLTLLLAAALVGNMFFYGKASDYESEAWSMCSLKNEAETKLKEAEEKLTQTEDSLNQAQERLAQAEAEADSFDGLFDLCRHGSDGYYPEKYILVLNKSETRNVAIHWKDTGTVTMRASSSSGIDNEWSREWSNQTTEVIITGRSSGYYTIAFTNDQNDDAFDILVIVKS